MITFIAVDFFELVDLEQYDLPLDILSLHPDKVVMQFIKGQVSCKANLPTARCAPGSSVHPGDSRA